MARNSRICCVGMLAAALSSALVAADARGEQNSHSTARGWYVGVFGGGGISRNGEVMQSGTAFISPGAGGPLSVRAAGSAGQHTTEIGGLHVGYEWAGWQLGKEDSGWRLLPAAEFEGYYLGTTQIGDLANPTPRIPEHLFKTTFPMDAGVFLANAVLTMHTPYRIHPYVGAGVGAAFVSIAEANSQQVSPAEPGINHFNSNPNASSWAFAAQAKTGARVDVVERWWLFAEYRFLYLSPTNYTFGSTQYATHVPTTEWTVHFGNMYYSLLVAGLGYNF